MKIDKVSGTIGGGLVTITIKPENKNERIALEKIIKCLLPRFKKGSKYKSVDLEIKKSVVYNY